MEGGLEYKRGLWTAEEDKILLDYIKVHGQGRWNRVSKVTGLKRRGKSCRLRWMNYLSPSVKRGDFSEQEDDLIIRLHNLLGNRWSLIAGRVPGRTDNQVKNYWNTHLSKKLGIKNTGKRAKPPSHVPTAQEEGKNSSGEQNSNLHLRTEDEQEGKKDETQPAIESDGQQELSAMAGSYDYSFWFSNDDLDLCIPNFMEQENDYSLDLFGMEWGAYNFSSEINE